MGRIKPDWSTLPEHLLLSIAKLLHTRFDILRFLAVCRSFRSTLPSPPKLQFPLSILTTTDFLQGPKPIQNNPFVLIESAIYVIQPPTIISNRQDETSQTWLVKVEETEPGRVEIKDPLSKLSFRNLSRNLPKSLNLIDYRVTEITRSYAFESTKDKLPYREYSTLPSLTSKVIFTACLDETDEGFAVMVKFGGRKLSLWRNIDKKWRNIDWGLEYIDDIIYHNRKFYAVTNEGIIMTVDSKSLIVAEVAAGPQQNYLNLLFVYLVESLEDLLLIAKYKESKDDYQFNFRVFRLDDKKFKWVPVSDELEDRALFVSRNGSYSVSAKEFSGCKGNCVYFLKNSFNEKYGYPGEDAWIFDLTDCKAKKLTDFPGYSKLFWPPPTWLLSLN